MSGFDAEVEVDVPVLLAGAFVRFSVGGADAGACACGCGCADDSCDTGAFVAVADGAVGTGTDATGGVAGSAATGGVVTVVVTGAGTGSGGGDTGTETVGTETVAVVTGVGTVMVGRSTAPPDGAASPTTRPHVQTPRPMPTQTSLRACIEVERASRRFGPGRSSSPWAEGR
jgi:hypothetical protein